MANALYDSGRNAFLTGAIDWSDNTGVTIKVRLMTSAYTVNLSTHTVLTDLAAAVGTDTAITGRTAVAGVADGSDTTFSAVAGGSTVTQFSIYLDTTVASTSTLIAHIDTASSGLPVVTNGGDIQIVWSEGADKIFKI